MSNCTLPESQSSSTQGELREQLFNGGAIGPITHIQLPADQITTIRGIMLDIDPDLIRPSQLIPSVPTSPPEFYEQVVEPWLSRHPTLAKAEVRDTGRGVHVILRPGPPIEICTSRDRTLWQSTIEIIQSALPSDPRAPGITATTRAIGSTNAKAGRPVSLLRPSTPCSVEELWQLRDELVASPFRFLFSVLAGAQQISPCPICRTAGSRLDALDYAGKCYVKCGTVTLTQLISEVMHDVSHTS